MDLNVDILSREIIKPFPNPGHASFELSLLDQFSPPFPVSSILFYSGLSEAQVERSDRLKSSLSETLCHFYPLGGKIKDEFWVDCEENGVNYIEAKVKGKFSEVLKLPVADELNKLLPNDVHKMGSASLLAIQVNMFDGGGMAIGVLISHKVADASSLCTFINFWAAKARGESDIISPIFECSSLFRPREVSCFVPVSGGQAQKLSTKRFVFDATNIKALREKSTKKPTRVEAVSALIWMRAMAAAKTKSGFMKPSKVNLAVNLRGRMVPSLSDQSFGNLIVGAIVTSTATSEREYSSLTGRLRVGLRSINAEFPFYEADFGWGKPDWVTSICLHQKNYAMLMDTTSQDGVEAWVTLEEQEMKVFESHRDLLEFVRVAPVA